MSKETNGWKILGIILIFVVIIETITLGSFIYLGMRFLEEEAKDIVKENTCIVNICKDYDAYWYDIETQVCECSTGGEWLYQEFIP